MGKKIQFKAGKERLDNCPHTIHSWLDAHPLEKKRVAEKVATFYNDRPFEN